jgi:hypothetical protein
VYVGFESQNKPNGVWGRLAAAHTTYLAACSLQPGWVEAALLHTRVRQMVNYDDLLVCEDTVQSAIDEDGEEEGEEQVLCSSRYISVGACGISRCCVCLTRERD